MRIFRLLLVAFGAVALVVGVWIADGGPERMQRAWIAKVMQDRQPSAATRAALDRDMRQAGVAWGTPAFVRIFKQESQLEVWFDRGGSYELFRTYDICRWSGRLGPKLKEGDRQAPEGFYRVGRSQLNPNSQHHLAFNLGFPNAFDRAHGRTGSYLMVHGGCSSAGCYAMTDRSVDDIYRIVEAALNAGQDHVPVHIFPFRMTERNWSQHGRGYEHWHEFWGDLQVGYDAFEGTRRPPRVAVRDKRYVVKGDVKLTKR